MTPYTDKRLTLANTIMNSIANKDTLTPRQARSFVRCLQTSWQVPTIHWRESETLLQVDDARRLIHSAEIYKQEEGASSINAIICYRRAAEIFEWIVRSTDGAQSFVPFELIAAAAYQLGGLPAMASSLLAQADLVDDGSRLYSSFLRADFDSVINSVASFWSNNPTLRNRFASEKILVEDGNDKISWYITVEIVRCLGLIADCLRRNDKSRLEIALTKLNALDNLAVRTFNDDISLLITLLNAVAREFYNSSIYRSIMRLAQNNEHHQKLLYSFARGQFSRGRGILWTSQKLGINRLLEESSFALCTPTGSGKTLVASLAVVKELLLQEYTDIAPLGLYLVPSRALAGEVEAKLTSELGEDIIITGLYGGTDWGVTDYWLTSDSPAVLVATVEKADALMRFMGPLIISRLKLLIIDEAHQVVPENSHNTLRSFPEHQNRSIRLEALVTRILVQSPNIVRIALTAVAGGASMSVAKWIEGIENAEAVGANYHSTRQLIGMLEISPGSSGRILIDLMNSNPLYVRGRDEPVYIPLRTPAMPDLPATWRNSIYRFTELNILWIALNLADDNLRILISIAQEPEQTMGWYKLALERDEWKTIVKFKPPDDENNLSRFMETRAACIDYCGINSFEVFLLDRGIASNHGQMPQRLRRLMTDLIERRICPITVATATLTEGVNLPFDLIFLSSLKRRTFDSTTNSLQDNPLSVSEFSNLAGRAGRPGSTNGLEGITLVAVPQRYSSTALSIIKTQKGQVKTMNSDYFNLIQRLQEAQNTNQGRVNSPLALLINYIAYQVRNTFGFNFGQFLEWLETITLQEIAEDAGTGADSTSAKLADSIDELDSILLSTLHELIDYHANSLDSHYVEKKLAEVWQKTFTNIAAVQESWLEQVFIRRGSAIINNIYPNADERERLYQYGFPPYIGRRFEQVAPVIYQIIESAKSYGNMIESERLSIFESIGSIIAADRGFGFRVRPTIKDQDLLKKWKDVLAWWMTGDHEHGPEPKDLRAWQRFVSDNLEFRLGLAIGAVVADAWSKGAGDPLLVPSLEFWRKTTGLPWFGFWARELLRWGTLDPLVAFSLAQGLAKTRNEADKLRLEFNTWLEKFYGASEADNLIDPQLFLKWQGSLSQSIPKRLRRRSFKAKLTQSTGKKGHYKVIPILQDDTIIWIDPSGYELAKSQITKYKLANRESHDDFELIIENGEVIVRQYII